jgi:hypothetical protein
LARAVLYSVDMTRESSLVIEFLRYRSLTDESRRQLEEGIEAMLLSRNRRIAVYALAVCKIIDSEYLQQLAERAQPSFTEDEWKDADQLVPRVLARLQRPSAIARAFDQ